MFKKLGKLLKKGTMSVEYIVIGVCVLGMATLATAFVSNKMDVAMGKENSGTTGDTNTGGGNSNNDSSTDNNTNLSSECKENKEFFEKWGLYLGTYRYNNDLRITTITLDKIVITWLDGYYLQDDVTEILDLKENKYIYVAKNKSTGIEDIQTYNGLQIENPFSYDIVDKNTSTQQEFLHCVLYYKYGGISYYNHAIPLPIEAFKLDGHEDCSGFIVDTPNFFKEIGIKEGTFNSDTKTIIIENNQIKYLRDDILILMIDFNKNISYQRYTYSYDVNGKLNENLYDKTYSNICTFLKFDKKNNQFSIEAKYNVEINSEIYSQIFTFDLEGNVVFNYLV